MKAIKKAIHRLITRRQRRATRRQAMVDSASTFPLQPWWEPSFWEPTVALAINDLCRPGSVVFDVGANAGGLSMMMSRLVGPRGIVCSFEASPRIIDKTQFNLVRAGCNNVTLYHRAVWQKSNARVNIEAGSHLNDRVVHADTGMAVKTIALDDFCQETNLYPSFIKMDIEGAEYDALLGSQHLIEKVRPAFVLEQSSSDMRCHELLVAAGYVAVDLATYRQVKSVSDLVEGSFISNLLYVSADKSLNSPYFSRAPWHVAASLSEKDFFNSDGGVSVPPVRLPPGRYIIHAKFDGEATDNEVFAGVEADGEVVFRYHSYSKLLRDCYSQWVIQLDRERSVNPYFRIIRGEDPSFKWRKVDIIRISAFDDWKGPLIT